jgi:hypothetical protein
MCNIRSLAKKCGDPNPPGTRTTLRICPAGEFNGFPKTVFQIKTDENAEETIVPGDKLRLGEAFDFAGAQPGEGYWRDIPIIVDTGEVVDTMVGEIGGKSVESEIRFFLAATNAEELEFFTEMMNCCFVAMLPDRVDNHRVLGRSDDPAWVETAEATTGRTSGDRRGTAYVLKHSAGTPAMIYDATLGINTTPVAESA